ncbi:hypothetical protein HPB50_019569 [Hyalomma asiaticum]|uniref:Uncharacterized protein n=1 Tax=Hyalomma asiaticum TaxID=266040 RepID=A0ACB7T619_HYAAI|nr:hypothetical protein HPB50_019569 [Hyalomma asiaticum]
MQCKATLSPPGSRSGCVRCVRGHRNDHGVRYRPSNVNSCAERTGVGKCRGQVRSKRKGRISTAKSWENSNGAARKYSQLETQTSKQRIKKREERLCRGVPSLSGFRIDNHSTSGRGLLKLASLFIREQFQHTAYPAGLHPQRTAH